MKKALAIALLSFTATAQAAPSEGECAVTTAVESPAAMFVKLPLILSNPVTTFVFAASSYRNSLCPRPELITKEQAEQMIAEAVARYVECGGDCKKVVASNNTIEE